MVKFEGPDTIYFFLVVRNMHFHTLDIKTMIVIRQQNCLAYYDKGRNKFIELKRTQEMFDIKVELRDLTIEKINNHTYITMDVFYFLELFEFTLFCWKFEI